MNAVFSVCMELMQHVVSMQVICRLSRTKNYDRSKRNSQFRSCNRSNHFTIYDLENKSNN